ncbi:Callose synthase 11 [Vitis vinifera]|uniref:Callose synthase 11 n=1 Tax=Vitis vinifera TaxID=29760 RepID=A0A438IGN2_VITVI|nr:Callose synthase 11 [Vitis vinifera]
MNLRHRPIPTRTRSRGGAYAPSQPVSAEVYNIIPIHDVLTDHPSLSCPEVRAAAEALRTAEDLRKPSFVTWYNHMDILDWLGMFFGFQNDNVRNQREHLVLHLANSQMRLSPPPKTVGSLDPTVLRDFRSKLLKNYTSWCSYLGRKSQLWLSNRRDALRRELLYVSLYLLIWGESANLRFCPECICYIFHHMALELNQILENYIDDNTGRPFEPSYGANGFLIRVVTPIYNIIKFEVDSSQNGTKPHSAWRNYDDINEFFWSRKCFRRLGWPINRGPKFLKPIRLRKWGRRAFVIVAWQGTEYPWKALKNRGVQVKLLTVFITWGALRFLQSVLDAGTQYSLVSRETRSLGVRMVLKSVVAITWTVVFGVFYGRIWSQKNSDGMWSDAANRRIITFLEAAFVFIIPELLALTLFMIPWVRICLEETNWKVLYCLTWWFHTRTFVGRGLREGPVTNMKTAIVVLWVPVLLIYLMDLQIWYAIFSSLVGGANGLFSHLGEIRNIEQLRLRFQFFASAMQFNLMPEEQTENTKLSLVKKLRDVIHRFKLRYGLGQVYKKIESSQVEATRFALIWNEIILTFREEDLISDAEHELLELHQNCWNIRVIRWPCVLLCNELLLALSQAAEVTDKSDSWLWPKICKNEYRRCAVIEAYDSIRSLLLLVVKSGSEENSIVANFFQEIERYIEIGKFTEMYKMTLLPQIHAKLISLIKLLLGPKKDHSKVVNVLQALYELCVREFPKVKRSIVQLRQEGLAPLSPAADAGLLFENAVEFPDAEDARHLRRLQTILTSRDSMHNVPTNLEARRRIAFFSNSSL